MLGVQKRLEEKYIKKLRVIIPGREDRRIFCVFFLTNEIIFLMYFVTKSNSFLGYDLSLGERI